MKLLYGKYQTNVLFWLLLLAIVYVFSIAKDPSLGDSLPFTIQAYHGFTFESNATNHFLFSNFLSLLYKILPFVNPHFLFVGVSIFSGILSLFCLHKLLGLLDVSPKSSLMWCTNFWFVIYFLETIYYYRSIYILFGVCDFIFVLLI